MEKGIAALLIVIILSVAALIIGVSVSMIGLAELDLGYTSERGEEVFYVADGCMEETLRRIRSDSSYGVGAGVINLLQGAGSCTIEVTDLGANQRQILVTGTVSSYSKRISSAITIIGGVISINEWRESEN